MTDTQWPAALTAYKPGARVYSSVWNEQGTITGLDAASGEVEWTSDDGTPSQSPISDLDIID